MKNILFLCKNNVFRSRIAEIFFNKYNKNKKYKASSAGLMPWTKKDLMKDLGYIAVKKVCKDLGINLSFNSKPATSSVLKRADIIIIVADDVPEKLIKTEQAVNGKVLVWEILGVKRSDKNKEKVARNTIKFIDKKVRNFVKRLR
ncbi:MAG TPA: hypothetical protein VJ142_02245 [Candidatus Nanoarchaeia archaeon]|nr:hypothetical protein [Candidatus Nanoarchaeia archaeon]